MLLPDTAPWWIPLALFSIIVFVFLTLMIGLFAPIRCCGIVQKGLRDKLKRLDLFPRVPRILDNSELRIKFYSPFGGIVHLNIFYVIIYPTGCHHHIFISGGMGSNQRHELQALQHCCDYFFISR